MITVKEVERRVKEIAALAHDPEAAHDAEDKLHQEVLLAIAHGAPAAKPLALAALSTRLIKFPRWCA